MGAVKIRRAVRKDAAVLAEYRYRLFRDMDPGRDYSASRTRFLKECRRYYESHMGRKNQYDCLAMIDGKTVGCGSILFWDRPPHIGHMENSMGYILNIYVDKEYRRKGISKMIMASLHRVATKRGMRKIGLHASRQGYPVYASMGYRPNNNYLEYNLR